MIAWELPARVTLAGLAGGRKNDIVTLHLLKAAPKMTRLDAATLRKRSAVRGDLVVEVKPGDAVLAVTEEWALERYVVAGKKEEPAKKTKAPVRKAVANKVATKKPASKKKTGKAAPKKK